MQTLPSGSHSIPFEFHLPADCPTSYEGSIGRVRYYVSARIRKLYEIEHTTMKLFTVINHLDVNNDLRLQVDISYATGRVNCLHAGFTGYRVHRLHRVHRLQRVHSLNVDFPGYKQSLQVTESSEVT